MNLVTKFLNSTEFDKTSFRKGVSKQFEGSGLCANASTFDLCARVATHIIANKLPKGLYMTKEKTYASETIALAGLLGSLLVDKWNICSKSYWKNFCDYEKSAGKKQGNDGKGRLYKAFLEEIGTLQQFLFQMFTYPNYKITCDSLGKINSEFNESSTYQSGGKNKAGDFFGMNGMYTYSTIYLKPLMTFLYLYYIGLSVPI